jgi:5-methylcytosine-specific restriction endonuclease McrA
VIYWDMEARTLRQVFGYRNEYRRKVKMKQCTDCGIKEDLTVHHCGNNYRNNKRSNLAVLCSKCHQKRHSRSKVRRMKV